jgi:alkyl hydroperoxide reductase subunit AhpC
VLKLGFICLTLTLLSVGYLLSRQNTIAISDDNDVLNALAPELAQGKWINSEPLTLSNLRGKVVLIEFWTFGCWNCTNTFPSVKKWYEKYKDQGFVVIGVHSPEFEREKVFTNVQAKVKDLGITYPVVTDNDFNTWRRYDNHYWPTMYLIDKKGIVRYVHIGEGEYQTTEDMIVALLKETS